MESSLEGGGPLPQLCSLCTFGSSDLWIRCRSGSITAALRSGTGGSSELLLKRIRLLFIDSWSKRWAGASHAALRFLPGRLGETESLVFSIWAAAETLSADRV